ncbi:rhomboid family protein, putative [Talaromyces stipitatus ATCC 10500]|uniref:Rhomboid family protein, putative n=1 Tax=Talaromyces stipitatus (strain ATCC 10500 / CBS 375.48 / QM 6759 / NRRL 1006) TaxID=441959 RepID=B8M749_TALSN|nr:rhomboid family protein, putative [Talaromyces stipitatus ATCC 10500]EED20270.1 rhomboid family protein, putative [Talaromyces stipitatus ATCC 10500]
MRLRGGMIDPTWIPYRMRTITSANQSSARKLLGISITAALSSDLSSVNKFNTTINLPSQRVNTTHVEMSNVPSVAWHGSCLVGIRALFRSQCAVQSSANSIARHLRRCWTQQQLSYSSLGYQQTWKSTRPTSHTVPRLSNALSRIRFASSAGKQQKEHGVPLDSQPLSAAEIKAIFRSSTVTPEMGNRILSVIHGRRLAGTLDQDLPSDITRAVRSKTIENGLRWLRANHPLDEDAAILARIEREEKEEEERLLRYVKEMGPQSGHWGAQLGEGNDIYGRSTFQEKRKVNEARLLAEQEKKRKEWLEGEMKDREKIQKQLKGNTELQKYNPSAVVEARPRADPRERPFLAWAQKHYIRAENTDTDFTSMTTARRILPALGVTLLVLGLCYFYAETYQPPAYGTRMWRDIPPAAATILGIIATNVSVWMLWKIPPAWRMLNRYFISVPLYPYAMSVVGSIFSHQQFKHLLTNTVILWLIGLRLHDEIGRGNFLSLYLSSGVIGSFVSLTSHVLLQRLTVTSLGASGAIAGLVAAWCMLHSDDKLVPSFLPNEWRNYLSANGSTVLLAIVAFEIFNLVSPFKVVGKLDNYAHLGGYFAGAVWAALYKSKGERERQRKRNEQRGFLERFGSM